MMTQYVKALVAENAHRPAVGIIEVVFVALAVIFIISL